MGGDATGPGGEADVVIGDDAAEALLQALDREERHRFRIPAQSPPRPREPTTIIEAFEL